MVRRRHGREVGDVALAYGALRASPEPFIDTSAVVTVQARERAELVANLELLHANHAFYLLVRGAILRFSVAPGWAVVDMTDGVTLDDRRVEAAMGGRDFVLVIVVIVSLPVARILPVAGMSAHTSWHRALAGGVAKEAAAKGAKA